MFVWEKFKTLCWLSNWIQRSIRKNASHPPCAPLAFLSRLKLSFPPLSNATQAIFSQVYKHGCNNLSAPCTSNPRRPSEGKSPEELKPSPLHSPSHALSCAHKPRSCPVLSGTQWRFPSKYLEHFFYVIHSSFRSLEIHSTRHRFCSFMLGDFECFRNYKGFGIIFPKILDAFYPFMNVNHTSSSNRKF